MKKNKDLTSNYEEIGFIDGNYEDKYNAKNPISKFLMDGFLHNFKELAQQFDGSSDILEIGSGEGHLLHILADMYPSARFSGCDLSERVNKLARNRLAKYKNVSIHLEDAEKVTFGNSSFDAIVCCEVLEHLEHPDKGLSEIRRILKPGGVAIVSVPHEPLWRILNIARFKYVRNFGNTPGHLNHWSSSSFKGFVKSGGFSIVQNKSPFPWTMLLIQKN